MYQFKCKMCGGTLGITNETVATCEYCGTQQTLPKLGGDRRANLYDRANHFRRNNEFDKAMGIYEQILNEDNTDAESYWSLVLCRYGIEYVEDPATHKRVPTVNRAQFTSIFDDDNYKSALQYADGAQRHVYEEEAKAINEIQKGILSISQKEEPFDVFICYKETDRNGRRTPDSVLANDLYHQLTQEGYKVFFSRITLEDKLGVAYEPYIFAALNSAKVMVVLGTQQEYFNAVWVKNEWSRYLSLIRNGANKILIPAYRDMDPYDLPDEFSHLQAQDMSKLGFMQDLIRGIKKITKAEEPKVAVVKETVITGAATNATPLLKRAFMFLEDGAWSSADEYCEKVLDMDPENAKAYLGKLMAELRVNKQESLKDQATPFDGNNYYLKVLRFSDEAMKEELKGYIACINDRNESARKDAILARAKLKKTVESIDKIAIITAPILCAVAIFIILLNSVIIPSIKYNKAVDLMDAGKYTEAIAAFEALDGRKDSADKISECNMFIMDGRYNEAIALMNAEEYARAITAFKALGGHKDSADKISECNTIIMDGRYNKAIALMDEGKYDQAIIKFKALDGHKDSAEMISQCAYSQVMLLLQKDERAKALSYFIESNGYNDANTYIDALRDELAFRETVSAGARHTVGLKSDGTLVAVGYNWFGRCNVANWKDIIAVSAGDQHTVGLKSDGTVVAVGNNDYEQYYGQYYVQSYGLYYGQCDVGNWTDIIAVSAGDGHTVGLKSDGTVVAVGYNKYGLSNVGNWTNIKVPQYHTRESR